ncbi:MAG: DUF1295 domain-containing protein [Vicinamibacterales bacterium]
MGDAAAPWFGVWAVLAVLFAALWLASLPLKNASIVDMWWGPAFVVAGAAYAGAAPQVGPRGLAILALVLAWALRLAWHIGRRNLGHGEDPRYAAWRTRHGDRWWWRSLVQVFLLQATVAWVVSWPIGAAVAGDRAPFPTAWDALGLVVAVVGLVVETVADAQLRRFKRTAPRGAVCDVGLWRYSRHPNYFGESVVWWGVFLVAAGAGAWWTVVSPLLMTWLLLRVSGVTLLEAGLSASKPGYAEYVRRTSAFVPWPPKP